MVFTTANAVDIFAANRATGHIALGVGAENGRSHRTRVHEEGSLRIRFPGRTADALEAMVVNTAGGMTGGDRFAIDLDLGPASQLVATTVAAEKIYRSTGADAETAITLTVGDNARLVWLPQETILFDRARLTRCIDVALSESASLIMAEAVVFGRTAMGEILRDGFFADRWRVRRGDRLAYADSVRLDGSIAEKLRHRAVAAGGLAIASALIAPSSGEAVEAVRALDQRFAGEVGISAWNDLAAVRFCAHDGAALRHDLIAVLAALGVSVPRIWLQ
ncbi:MAG: urease accessory protein UreD [Xanthobacteraceae bacterium]